MAKIQVLRCLRVERLDDDLGVVRGGLVAADDAHPIHYGIDLDQYDTHSG